MWLGLWRGGREVEPWHLDNNFVELFQALIPLGRATWQPPGLPHGILSLAQKQTNNIAPTHHLCNPMKQCHLSIYDLLLTIIDLA